MRTPEQEALCRQLFERLLHVVEADATTAAEMQEYLRECEPCVAFVESLERTRELCRQMAAKQEAPWREDALEHLRKAYLLQDQQ